MQEQYGRTSVFGWELSVVDDEDGDGGFGGFELEAGARVPLDRLTTAMQDWFRRKSYLTPTDHLRITEPAAGK